MEEGQVWSRYTSEAQQLKIEDLQTRIKQAEFELEEKQRVINTALMVPKSITLRELHGCKSGTTRHSMNAGRDLNVVLTIGGSVQSNLTKDEKSLAYLTQDRKKPGTSYGTRTRANFRNDH